MSLAKPKNQTITPATVPITVAARVLFETFMSYTDLGKFEERALLLTEKPYTRPVRISSRETFPESRLSRSGTQRYGTYRNGNLWKITYGRVSHSGLNFENLECGYPV